MAVIYSDTVKTTRTNAVATAIGATGKIKLFTAADALLATFTLTSQPSVLASPVRLSFNDNNGASAGILSATATGTGIAAKATVTTSADVDVITGLTVGTSGTDFIIDNTNIATGQNITITSATITHA